MALDAIRCQLFMGAGDLEAGLVVIIAQVGEGDGVMACGA